MKKRNVLMHQLALLLGLKLTAGALDEGLAQGKKLGHTGMIVVPKAFDPSLTAPIAGEIALKHGMTLNACGFLPGNEFNTYRLDDMDRCEAEIIRQATFQQVWQRMGCAGDVFNGPIDQPWMNRGFNYTNYMAWLQRLNRVAQRLSLRFAIEPLNLLESSVPQAFKTLVHLIRKMGLTNLGIQYDTGHGFLREVTMDELEGMIDLVLMWEFANYGRNPLDMNLGIDFMAMRHVIDQLPDGTLFASEPFNIKGVIEPLGLKTLCNTEVDGIVGMERDARYLTKHLGIMAAVTA